MPSDCLDCRQNVRITLVLSPRFMKKAVFAYEQLLLCYNQGSRKGNRALLSGGTLCRPCSRSIWLPLPVSLSGRRTSADHSQPHFVVVYHPYAGFLHEFRREGRCDQVARPFPFRLLRCVRVHVREDLGYRFLVESDMVERFHL